MESHLKNKQGAAVSSLDESILALIHKNISLSSSFVDGDQWSIDYIEEVILECESNTRNEQCSDNKSAKNSKAQKHLESEHSKKLNPHHPILKACHLTPTPDPQRSLPTSANLLSAQLAPCTPSSMAPLPNATTSELQDSRDMLVQSFERLFRDCIEEYERVKEYLLQNQVGLFMLENKIEKFRRLRMQDQGKAKVFLRSIAENGDCVLAIKLVYDLNNQLIDSRGKLQKQKQRMSNNSINFGSKRDITDLEFQRIDEQQWSLIQALAHHKTSQTLLDTPSRRFSTNQQLSDDITTVLKSMLQADLPSPDPLTLSPRSAAKKLSMNIAIHNSEDLMQLQKYECAPRSQETMHLVFNEGSNSYSILTSEPFEVKYELKHPGVMALETRRYLSALPEWLVHFFGNRAIFRIICCEKNRDISDFTISQLKQLAYHLKQYSQQPSQTLRCFKGIINTCLSLKEQCSFNTQDLITESFVSDKRHLSTICKIVDFRARTQVLYRQTKNSWLFVKLMDQIYAEYRVEDILEPITMRELLDDCSSENADRKKLQQICSLLYRCVLDDIDLQHAIKDDKVTLPEMVSRRFLINFLLLWADQSVSETALVQLAKVYAVPLVSIQHQKSFEETQYESKPRFPALIQKCIPSDSSNGLFGVLQFGLSHTAICQVGKTSILNNIVKQSSKDQINQHDSEVFEENDICVLSNGQVDLFMTSQKDRAYMDVTGKPLKEAINVSLSVTNIVIIHADSIQIEEDQVFLDKLEKWIVDIKAEDESIKIVLLVRDADSHQIIRESEDIRSVIGEGVFEDDLAAVILLEDFRDLDEREQFEMIDIISKEVDLQHQTLISEGHEPKFTKQNYNEGFLSKAREGENSIVFDGFGSDATQIRKSHAGLLKQSFKRDESDTQLSEMPQVEITKIEPNSILKQSIAVESSMCSVIDLQINNGPNAIENQLDSDTNYKDGLEINYQYQSVEEKRFDDSSDHRWTPTKVNNNILEIKLSNSKIQEPIVAIALEQNNLFNANSPSIFDLDVQKETLTDEQFDLRQKLQEFEINTNSPKNQYTKTSMVQAAYNTYDHSTYPNQTNNSSACRRRAGGERVTKEQRRQEKLDISREQERENRIEAMISKTRLERRSSEKKYPALTSFSKSLNRSAQFNTVNTSQCQQHQSPKQSQKVPYYLLDSGNTESRQFNKIKCYNTSNKLIPGINTNYSRVLRSPIADKQPSYNGSKKMIMKSPVPRIRQQNTHENLTTYQQLLKKQPSIVTVDLANQLKTDNGFKDLHNTGGASSELSHRMMSAGYHRYQHSSSSIMKVSHSSNKHIAPKTRQRCVELDLDAQKSSIIDVQVQMNQNNPMSSQKIMSGSQRMPTQAIHTASTTAVMQNSFQKKKLQHDITNQSLQSSNFQPDNKYQSNENLVTPNDQISHDEDYNLQMGMFDDLPQDTEGSIVESFQANAVANGPIEGFKKEGPRTRTQTHIRNYLNQVSSSKTAEIENTQENNDMSFDQAPGGDRSDDMQVSEGERVPPQMVGSFSARQMIPTSSSWNQLSHKKRLSEYKNPVLQKLMNGNPTNQEKSSEHLAPAATNYTTMQTDHYDKFIAQTSSMRIQKIKSDLTTRPMPDFNSRHKPKAQSPNLHQNSPSHGSVSAPGNSSKHVSPARVPHMPQSGYNSGSFRKNISPRGSFGKYKQQYTLK